MIGHQASLAIVQSVQQSSVVTAILCLIDLRGGRMLARSRVINHIAGSVICRTLYPYLREARYLTFVSSAYLTPKGCHSGLIVLLRFTLKPCKHLVIGFVLLLPFSESSIRNLSLLPLTYWPWCRMFLSGHC